MAQPVYNSVRGTTDFAPVQAADFQAIMQTARTVCSGYGYDEIILPVLEEEGVFRRGVGETTDIVEKQMFTLTKRSEESKDIVLRPEGTAQVIRFFVENSLFKQGGFHKFSYFGPMFRGERPQKGRLRQFHHIGVEAIGSASVYVDAEILDLSTRIIKELGIQNFELQLNSLGCIEDKERFMSLLKEQLDRKKEQLCDDCQRRLSRNPLRVLDCKQPQCKKLVAGIGIEQQHLCSGCQQEFSQLRRILDDLGIEYVYSPHLVRGLDYYTNTVFEITSKQLGSQDAVGAGGRYNRLVGALGGPDLPAIGFALGVERIMLARSKQAQTTELKGVFVVAMTKDLFDPAFALLEKLRHNGIAADIDFRAGSLKSQLRYAQKKNAAKVIIFGEDEYKDNCVMVKDMENGTQDKVNLDTIIELF